MINDLRPSNSALGKLLPINLLVYFYDESVETRKLALIQSLSKLEIVYKLISLYYNPNSNK